MDRRSFLLATISVPPLLAFLSPSVVFAEGVSDTSFMAVSRVLIGRQDLSPDIGNRIATLLQQRIGDYPQKLDRLAKALAPAALSTRDRSTVLKALSEEDTDLALEIAKPWYLGYVGTPAGSNTKDNAVFVTYLDAQAYELVLEDLPRTSYPPGGSGWWQAVPEGVTSPAMPERITDWTWQPDGATGKLAKPDPAWRAYAMGEQPTLAAARAALSSGGNTAGTSTTPNTTP